MRLDYDPRFDPNTERILNLLITYDKHSDKFKVCLVCEVQEPLPKLTKHWMNIDLGETWLAAFVDSTGNRGLISGRLIKSIRRYWNKVQRHVKPPNQQNPKMSRRYRQIRKRESRQVHHLLHIASKWLVNYCLDNGIWVIYVGDLTGITDKFATNWYKEPDKEHQHRYAWAWRIFLNMLTYKATKAGILVWLEDEHYTSRTCPDCGVVKKSNRVTRGWYSCKCGFSDHADLVGASNMGPKVEANQAVSGALAAPVVLRPTPHTIYDPVSSRSIQ